MTGTGGKAVRVVAVAVLTVASTGALAVPAAVADVARPAAVKTNWWWSLASPTVNGTTLPAGAPSQASNVPDGDLGVGYVADQAGTSDKVAAVALDLTSIPVGSTFSALTMSVPYDPNAHQLASPAAAPDISACELIAPFADAPGPSDAATIPPASLPSCVKGTFKGTVGTAGGYVFDLTAMANDWSGGAPAEGVLLQPTAGLATPQPGFSLAFLGKGGITSQATYTTPPPPVLVSPGAVVPPPPSLAPQPPLSGFAPQPAVVPVPPPVPAASVPAPQVNPAPTVAPALAVKYEPGALVPGTRWWLALLGVLALLGLTSLVLGDPMAPVPVEGRRRRFAQVIRAGGTASGRRVATARPVHRPHPV